MADPQYDAYRERLINLENDAAEADYLDQTPITIRSDPDAEPPESSEDRYRDVINDEAERLPPEIAELIITPSGLLVCPECDVAVVLGGPEAEECDGCGRDIHVQCRSLCVRCHDYYCSSCLIGETCSACYDDLRYGEYRRGGVTKEV